MAQELGIKIGQEMKKEENLRCADCGKLHPKWISTNLGIYICLQCSSVHRSLGTNISQVRSIGLDALTIGQAKTLISIGNKKANDYWEYFLPEDFKRPNWDKDGKEITQFIKDKYAGRKWAPKTSFDDFTQKGITEPQKEEKKEEPAFRELPTFDLLI